MKKYNILTSVIFSSIIFLVSCSDDNLGNVQSEELGQEEALEQILTVQNSLLTFTPNVYHDYFVRTENTVGFSSVQPNPLDKDYFSQRNVFSGKENEVVIMVNKSQITGKGATSKLASEEIDNIYGQEIDFSMRPSNGVSFKDGTTSKKVKMYVPKKLRLKNPKIKNEADLLPICYYDDFVLEWNPDRKNKEGLVVVVEYLGMSAIPEKDRKVQIMNTDIIEIDNGRAVLDNDLWKGIPDTGVVHLTLLRGNVQIEEVEGEQFKFYAETHAIVAIILLRDLDTLE